MFRKLLTYTAASTGFAVTTYAGFFAPTHRSKKHEPKIVHQDTDVIIYSWFPSPEHGGVGHQTLLIPPKKSDSTSEPKYLSLWPNNGKASAQVVMLPFKIWGVDGRLVENIAQDIEIEERMPDKILVVSGLDIEKMHSHEAALRSSLEKKEVEYRFFCNVPGIGFMKPTVRGFNCTSLTRKMLEHGGYPEKGSLELMPWGDTPIGSHLSFSSIGAREVVCEKEMQKLIQLALKGEELKLKKDDYTPPTLDQ